MKRHCFDSILTTIIVEQVVSFCDIFLRKTSARHILCIMPINTLQNWLAEFNMWMPAESAVNGDAEPGQEIRPRAFGLFLLNDSQKTLTARAKVRSLVILCKF